MMRVASTRRAHWRGALAGLLALGWALLAPGEARAQHVCVTNPALPAATAVGADAFACGPDAFAAGDELTAVGAGAGAGSNPANWGSTVVGSEAGRNVTGNWNIAVGYRAGRGVTGTGNIGIGFQAGDAAQGSGNVATGITAGFNAIGSNNVASGNSAGAYVTGDDNVAIGARAGSGTFANRLVASRTIAIGADSRAAQDDSIAIGNGVETTRVGQVAIGNAASTYTLAGVASAESRAAQTGPTYVVTTDAEGNLATSTFNIREVENGLAATRSEIAANRKEARQGIAAAIAMASAPLPSNPGRTSWAANVGFFRGETAFGGSLTHRFDTDIPIGVTLGYSYGGGKNHAARFGLAGEL